MTEQIPDFEDMLTVLHGHEVRYLIVGGLAFIYHAKPRYTKDMDLWVAWESQNIRRANEALAEFGSPILIDESDGMDQVIQIGVAPNRIDFLFEVSGPDFETAWGQRIVGSYGDAPANWIDLDSLIQVKEAIEVPRHQEDARVLRAVRSRHRS